MRKIDFFLLKKKQNIHTIPISGLRVVTQAQHDFEGKKKEMQVMYSAKTLISSQL